MDFFFTAVLQGIAFSGLALGIYLSLRIFRVPDITTDGSYTLGGVITAILLTLNWHPLLVLPVCMLGGWIAGWTTGYVHTKFRVHPLLAGILVMTALYSVNLLLMGRPNLPLTGTRSIFFLSDAMGNTTSYFSVLLLFCVLLIILLGFILKTDFGIAMRATGENELMAAAQGIHTDRMKRKGLAMANCLTAISGYLMVQYQGFADINMGIGIVISGMAAVIIGESMALSGAGLMTKLLIVITGSVVFRLILAAALAAGLDPAYLKLVTSLFVLAVVAINSKIVRRPV
jgi:putative tryptophan/tyrosine transport system permease protein